jgi:glucans biosynthesis protein
MGLAPLTSMFFIGSADRGANDDFRPNVHDSDTLLVHPDERRWIARPLNNPSAISVLHFESENPKGFGLLQRERLFSNYQDLEAEYHLRPAYWVKPLSDWGKGSVSLVELPTRSEAEDNIVAFWNPSRVLAAGDSAEWRYRLTAMAEEARLHDLGRVAATRYSLAKASDAMVQRSFVIDFDRDDLGFVSLDLSPVEIVVDVLGGAVERTSLSRHKSRDGIRAKFDVRAPPGANPQISVYLRRGSRILTETWVYNFADGR